MAHFYASINGAAKTEGTRTGTTKSGISGHIRGWNSGVSITGFIDSEGNDVFHVYATGGSNGSTRGKLIAQIDVDSAGNRNIRLLTVDGTVNDVL